MVRYRPKKGRKNMRPSKEQFEYQYYDLKMEAEELAQIYKVKTNTIYNWASQFRKEEEEKQPL